MRGNSKNKKGYFKNAIDDFDIVIQNNPNDTNAYINRGNAKCGLQEFNNAILDYNKALELEPNNKLANDNKNLAIYNINKSL